MVEQTIYRVKREDVPVAACQSLRGSQRLAFWNTTFSNLSTNSVSLFCHPLATRCGLTFQLCHQAWLFKSEESLALPNAFVKPLLIWFTEPYQLLANRTVRPI
jgi:hypothetical protein